MAGDTRQFPEKVLIYEHFSAGGMDRGKDSESLAAEGLCMAGALFSHFMKSEMTVPCLLLRKELLHAIPDDQRKYILPAFPGKAEELLFEECHGGMTVVLIAPETGGLSTRLAKDVQKAGGSLLGSDPETISLASNKAWLLRRLVDGGVPCVPSTVVSCTEDAREAADKAGYPVVTKPLRGTGGEGSALLKSEKELEKYFRSVEGNHAGQLVLQPFVEGFPASLSILAGRGGALRLVSVNRQDIVQEAIEGNPPLDGFRYAGGMTGLSEKNDPRIRVTGMRGLERLAEKTVGILGGLLGYAGIDLIMTENGPLVLEVNPRMTTPLAVLARHVGWNMADVLVDACVSGKIPEKLAVPVTAFVKENMTWPTPPKK
ncbi:MAG: ATP-grasp domain-containing protein [Thermovirgaceae bacterium]